MRQITLEVPSSKHHLAIHRVDLPDHARVEHGISRPVTDWLSVELSHKPAEPLFWIGKTDASDKEWLIWYMVSENKPLKMHDSFGKNQKEAIQIGFRDAAEYLSDKWNARETTTLTDETK